VAVPSAEWSKGWDRVGSKWKRARGGKQRGEEQQEPGRARSGGWAMGGPVGSSSFWGGDAPREEGREPERPGSSYAALHAACTGKGGCAGAAPPEAGAEEAG